MKHPLAYALIGCALFAAFAPPAFGQALGELNFDRILRFAHTESPQSLNEIATAIRSVADIRQASVAAEERVLALRGTPSQMAMAEWLFAKLDQTPALRPPTEVSEFSASAGSDDVIRVFYLNYPENVQAFQEIATAIRSVVEIRRVFTYNALKALVVRGPAEQIAAAEWLVNELDRPLSRAAKRPVDYKYPKNSDDAIRIFHLSPSLDTPNFQEIATLVRSTAEIRRVFTVNPSKALLVRCSPEQLALANWLVAELDPPAGTASKRAATVEFQVPTGGDDLVRVFFLPQIATVQGFQEVATLIRSQASLRRVFTYNAPRALVVRGTVDQLTQAERLTREFDRR